MIRFRALVLAAVAGVAAGGCGSSPPSPPPRPAPPATSTDPVALVRWGYRPDPHDLGVRRGWSRGTFAARLVSVPHAADAWAVNGAAGHRAYAGSIGWYRRTVAVRGGRYVLRFGSAHYVATVWIDGRLAARHTGAYEAFAVRARLARGAHIVVVRVDWRSPAGQR